jgi:membrane protein
LPRCHSPQVMTRKGKTGNAVNIKEINKRTITAGKILLQRVFITLQFSGQNSLANHAAACAYGFLLSAAPLLLITSFILFHIFEISNNSIITLIRSLPFLEIAIDEQWLSDNFYSIMFPGLSGFATILSFIWAGKLLAVSLQRGLKTIFIGSKKRNPASYTLVILAFELPALLLSLAVIFSSRAARRFYETFNFLPKRALFDFFASKQGYFIFTVMALGFVTYCAYRLIPANPPQPISAFLGGVFCIILYKILSLALSILLGQSRYNFLYGTFGNLVTLLINVYFFFLFFLMGGQFAYVSDSFDSFLFLKMRKARMNAANGAKISSIISKATDRLFLSIEGSLRKYYRFHKKGETIFFEKDKIDAIYYILKGEVESSVLSGVNNYAHIGTYGADSFFGEIGYLLSEDRSTTIKAKTDVEALALPPRIFDAILKYDASIDRSLIENLYRNFKNKNAQLASLESGER